MLFYFATFFTFLTVFYFYSNVFNIYGTNGTRKKIPDCWYYDSWRKVGKNLVTFLASVLLARSPIDLWLIGYQWAASLTKGSRSVNPRQQRADSQQSKLLPGDHAAISWQSLLACFYRTNSKPIFIDCTLSSCRCPRLYSFCYRVVNVWNSLPDYVVEADSVNSFKNRLDKYWPIKSLFFSFNSELMGTGGLPVCT